MTETDKPEAAEAAPRAQGGLPYMAFALLIGVTVFWGLNWPGMKIVLGEMGPWWFRTICLVGGGAGLLMLSGLSGNRIRVAAADMKPLMLCAIFNMVGWHLFSAYGLTYVPAGRASIIAFTMPVWAALFSIPLLGERLSLSVVAGLVLSMGGMAVLIGHDLSDITVSPLGSALMLGAAISWGTGTVLFKRFKWQTPVATIVAMQLLLAAVPIGVGALIIEQVPDPTALSVPAIIALVYVLVFPMIFCQWAYFKVVSMFPAIYAAIGVTAVPIVGVYSSLLILGEPVGWREVLALVLVCAAIFTVLVLPQLKSRR